MSMNFGSNLMLAGKTVCPSEFSRKAPPRITSRVSPNVIARFLYFMVLAPWGLFVLALVWFCAVAICTLSVLLGLMP